MSFLRPVASVARDRQRGLGLMLAAFAALLHSPFGAAQVYGFVDGEGVAHFAAEPVDARYRLLSGSRVLDMQRFSVAVNVGTPSVERLRRHPGLIRYESLFQRTAAEFGIDPALLMAIAAAESGFDPGAVSAKGAVGLMQVMPGTAERFGLVRDAGAPVAQRLMDPETNVRLSARYLAELSRIFPGEPLLVVAAYNAGEGAVRRYGNVVPPFAETRGYVALVSRLHRVFGAAVPEGMKVRFAATRQPDAPARIRLTIPAPGQAPDGKSAYRETSTSS